MDCPGRKDHLGDREHRDLTVSVASTEPQVFRVLLASQASKAILASAVRLVRQEVLDCRDKQVCPALLDRRAPRASQVLLVRFCRVRTLDRLGHLDRQEKMDRTESLAARAQLDLLVRWVRPALLAVLERLESRERRDRRESLELLDSMGRPDVMEFLAGKTFIYILTELFVKS